MSGMSLEKAFAKIEESIGEIKGNLNNLVLGMEVVRRDIQEQKDARRINAERITDKMDKMMISLSNLCLAMNDLTAPRIFSACKVNAPDLIDTTPLDIYDELTKVASEIQGEISERCKAFEDTMYALTDGRDSIQCLADYVEVLKSLRAEIVSRRERIESLKRRRRNADKDSNEQKNAALLIVKVRSMLKPLEQFTRFVLDSFYCKRRRIISEVWRTSVAIEELYDEKSEEFKDTIPAASEDYRITSALRELAEIENRHAETYKSNMLVRTGHMSSLERRKILAGLKTTRSI